MLPGDGDFFFGDIARQADHFHAVEQGAGNAVQGVGRADEQGVAKVQAFIQIVIEKVLVLLRVEYFQKRGSRVALKRLAQLVDFIKHDHRVAGAGFFQRLDQFAGHGADVGTAMPLDFRFVAHAAQAEAVELAIQGIGDGLANAGFADPWRTHQQNDGAFHFATQGAHGEKLDDAVFHIIQPAVVFAEHCLGMA